jgi:hypothetical protein
MYGAEVTMDQIKTAFTSSLAVIVHGWADQRQPADRWHAR